MEGKKRRIHWGCFALPYWILVMSVDIAVVPRNILFPLVMLGEMVVWGLVGAWLDKKGWMDPGPAGLPPPFW